jgi:hypothetical protein
MVDEVEGDTKSPETNPTNGEAYSLKLATIP